MTKQLPPDRLGERHNRFVRTTCDWYPVAKTEDGIDYVVGSVIMLNPPKTIIRTCFWGGDDYGIEIDEKWNNELFEERCKWLDELEEVIPEELILLHGFYTA